MLSTKVCNLHRPCSLAARTRTPFSATQKNQRCLHAKPVAANAGNISVSEEGPQATAVKPLGYEHVLLAILDANPFLSDGSKQATSAAAQMASTFSSKLTVLVVDEQGTTAADPATRIKTLTWHLNQHGLSNYEFLEKSTDVASSVMLGDVADSIGADLLLLSADAVHRKYVDSNLLVEMVSCPILLLP